MKKVLNMLWLYEFLIKNYFTYLIYLLNFNIFHHEVELMWFHTSRYVEDVYSVLKCTIWEIFEIVWQY